MRKLLGLISIIVVLNACSNTENPIDIEDIKENHPNISSWIEKIYQGNILVDSIYHKVKNNRIINSSSYSYSSDGNNLDKSETLYEYTSEKLSRLKVVSNNKTDLDIIIKYDQKNITEILSKSLINENEYDYSKEIFDHKNDTIYVKNFNSTNGIDYIDSKRKRLYLLDNNGNRIYYKDYNGDEIITTYDSNKNIIFKNIYDYNLFEYIYSETISTETLINVKTFGRFFESFVDEFEFAPKDKSFNTISNVENQRLNHGEVYKIEETQYIEHNNLKYSSKTEYSSKYMKEISEFYFE